MVIVYGSSALKFRSIGLRYAGVANMDIVQSYHFANLSKTPRRERTISAPKIGAILRSDDGHLDLSGDGVRHCIRSNRARKTDPRVSVVSFGVGAGSVEHALDCVRCAGDVSATLDGCECWSKQDQ